MTKTFKELGFKKQSGDRKRKAKVPKPGYRYKPGLDELAHRIRAGQRHIPNESTPNISVAGGHDDLIEKGEDGFESYFSGKWRTGYPV